MTNEEDAGSVHQNRSAKNTFTSLTLDRAPRRRRDRAWIAEQLEAPTTRFLPIWRSRVLVTRETAPRAAWLSLERARELTRQAESVILLGESEEQTYVALGLTTTHAAPPTVLTKLGTFQRLRTVAPLLDGHTAALLAYAKAMVHYHHGHQFCARCGSPTRSEQGGHLRACTSVSCGQQDFPRTDPAIITLVTSKDQCLLARQPAWPKNLYSIIAGFVEPGESLEAAVAREVREETGVRVGQVRYHSSQPWPFPRSLMIGFTAVAETTTIRLRDGELERARWLSREAIVRELRQGRLQLPSTISISHRLIERWFDAEGTVALSQILASV
jgi:NAD+ diphosphatase